MTAYQRSTDPGERATLRGRIDALIHGLKSIALERDGRLYYPVPPRERPVDADELFYPRGGWQGGDEPRGTGVMCAAAPVLRPIVQYLMTGARNPEAVALCDGLARYVVERADDFGPDGSFRGHFHSRVATAAGILLWGRYSEQPDLVRWAHAVYRFARTVGTSFGWFPEFVGEHACETCGITDMIDLAILLAGAGHPQYWNDAERFGRNHLAESQFLDAAWERQVPKLGATATAEFIDSCAPVQLKREGVRDVLPGAFSGGSAPNAVVDTAPRPLVDGLLQRARRARPVSVVEARGAGNPDRGARQHAVQPLHALGRCPQPPAAGGTGRSDNAAARDTCRAHTG